MKVIRTVPCSRCGEPVQVVVEGELPKFNYHDRCMFERLDELFGPKEVKRVKSEVR